MNISKINNISFNNISFGQKDKEKPADKDAGLDKSEMLTGSLRALAAQVRIMAKNTISVSDFVDMGGEIKDKKASLMDEPYCGALSIERNNGDLYVIEFDEKGVLKASTKIPEKNLVQDGFVKQYVDEDTTNTFYLNKKFKVRKYIDNEGVTNVVFSEPGNRKWITYKKGEFIEILEFDEQGRAFNSKKMGWRPDGTLSYKRVCDSEADTVAYYENDGKTVKQMQEMVDTDKGVNLKIYNKDGVLLQEERYIGHEILKFQYAKDGRTVLRMDRVPNPDMEQPKEPLKFYFDYTKLKPPIIN